MKNSNIGMLLPQLAVLGGLVFASSLVSAASLTVASTLQDPVITGGAEAIFALSGVEPIVDPGYELVNFIGFYDVDVTMDSLVMTLVGNSGMTDTVIPAGRFDRYYFNFDTPIRGASLDGVSGLNSHARVSILDPGTNLHTIDPFRTTIPSPNSFPNGGLMLEFKEGTDLSSLGVQAKVNLEFVNAVPEPAAGMLSAFAAIGLVGLRARRQR